MLHRCILGCLLLEQLAKVSSLDSSSIYGPQVTEYLSEEAFLGLELLDIDGDSLHVHRSGQKPDAPGASPTVELSGALAWKDMAEVRTALEKQLEIPPPEPLQQPWALFDYQGKRLTTVDELRNVHTAFLIMLGQWMWPGVRVGFEQQAHGVLRGEPLTLVTKSLRPVVFTISGFIRDKETDEVITLGQKGHMFNSEGQLVTADKNSKRAHNDYRTSTQAWLSNGQSEVVKALDDRTSNLTRIPTSHNEPVQLLQYAEGQFYHSHLDWTDLHLYDGQRQQMQRVHYGHNDRLATLFWYLNDVEEGGQTVFPKQGNPVCPMNSKGQRIGCKGFQHVSPRKCDVGLQIQPKKGSVVLWYNYHADGSGDQNSEHGGCPPRKGLTKWSGNKWIGKKPQHTSPAAWMPDHPALMRIGYSDASLAAERAASPTGCKLWVKNKFKKTVNLMWVSQGAETSVGSAAPGDKFSLDSHDGHSFLFKVDDTTRSSPFQCKGKMSAYFYSENGEVVKSKKKKSEL